jgi:hypothetical protein
MGKYPDKQLINQSKEQVREDVEDGTAIPELILKREIIDSMSLVKNLAKNMRTSKLRNNNSINPNLKYDLEGSLVGLWFYIEHMVYVKKIEYLRDIKQQFKDYDTMIELYYGKKQFNEYQLMRLASYLGWCTFKLKLTDLIVKKEQEDNFEEHFEKEW